MIFFIYVFVLFSFKHVALPVWLACWVGVFFPFKQAVLCRLCFKKNNTWLFIQMCHFSFRFGYHLNSVLAKKLRKIWKYSGRTIVFLIVIFPPNQKGLDHKAG
jgi:hypothetical protein